MIKIELPYPISTNRYWRNYKGRTVLSREAKAYKQEIAYLMKQKGVKPTSKNVRLIIEVVPKQNKDGSASKVLIDLDNALKVLIDALQFVAYENDKQVKEIRAFYSDKSSAYGAVLVSVEEMVFNGKFVTKKLMKENNDE